MASISPRGLAVIDHLRQSQQFCADTQLALRCGIQVHHEAHAVLLHNELHDPSGFGEPIEVADGQDAGILKTGQNLRAVLAFGGADEENVTAAKVVTTTVLYDYDCAPLYLL